MSASMRLRKRYKTTQERSDIMLEAYKMKSSQLNRLRAENGLLPVIEKDRECLRCGVKFRSYHVNNRLCGVCGGVKFEYIY